MKMKIFVLVIGLSLLITACSSDTGAADRTSDALDDAGNSVLSGQAITADDADNSALDGQAITADDADNSALGEQDITADDVDSSVLSWQTITATEARNMMVEAYNFILLDVRTEEEFRERRIDGALLIPYDEIWDRAEMELSDKDAVILLYCRSGRRSALAAEELVALGYANIYDFGGINDWPYESVSG